MMKSAIRHEFEIRSKKQLLVALSEITQGPDFKKIVTKEFEDITDGETRTIYLSACLATAENASLSRDQLLAISGKQPAETLLAIERDLNQMLVGVPGNRIAARHAVIASIVVETAGREVLAEAYKRVLRVLAHDMNCTSKSGPARRWFRLYKSIVNHAKIYERFERDLDKARDIFDALNEQLRGDAHYWLQYGSLELEYGEVRFARHYLASAEGLAPTDPFVLNAKGHLLLLEAKLAGNRDAAVRLRQEGKDLLQQLIQELGDGSPYPCHTLLAHDLDWLQVWEHDSVAMKGELEQLRELAASAVEDHPWSEPLHQIRERIERAYLNLGVGSTE